MTSLDSPLTVLTGVGPALDKKLARLDLRRVEDLLFLLPNRYEDRTSLIKIGSLRPGLRCLVSGEVLLAEVVYRGRRNLLVRISDGTGQLTLRFFHFSKQQQAQFQTGVIVSCFGDVRAGPVGLEMVHPEYRILKPDQNPVLSDALTPIYPTTEGVQQGRLRNLASQALGVAKSSPPAELLPEDIRRKYDMPALVDALLYLHQPPPDADLASIELRFLRLVGLAGAISLPSLAVMLRSLPGLVNARRNSRFVAEGGVYAFFLVSVFLLLSFVQTQIKFLAP